MIATTRSFARTVALAFAVAAGGTVVTGQAASACGGYGMTLSEPQRVQRALAAFLGEYGQHVSYGAATITLGTHAELTVESDADPATHRARVRQTFRLEKRDRAWTVVTCSAPQLVAPPMWSRR